MQGRGCDPATNPSRVAPSGPTLQAAPQEKPGGFFASLLGTTAPATSYSRPKRGDSGDKRGVSSTHEGKPHVAKWGQSGDIAGTKWGHSYIVKKIILIPIVSSPFCPAPAPPPASLWFWIHAHGGGYERDGPSLGTPSAHRAPVDNFCALVPTTDAHFMGNASRTRNPLNSLSNS